MPPPDESRDPSGLDREMKLEWTAANATSLERNNRSFDKASGALSRRSECFACCSYLQININAVAFFSSSFLCPLNIMAPAHVRVDRLGDRICRVADEKQTPSETQASFRHETTGHPYGRTGLDLYINSDLGPGSSGECLREVLYQFLAKVLLYIRPGPRIKCKRD